MNLIINKKTFTILTQLKQKPLNFSELLKVTKGSTTTLKEYIHGLIEKGFITEKKEREFPFSRKFYITTKGLNLIDDLEKIKKRFKALGYL